MTCLLLLSMVLMMSACGAKSVSPIPYTAKNALTDSQDEYSIPNPVWIEAAGFKYATSFNLIMNGALYGIENVFGNGGWYCMAEGRKKEIAMAVDSLNIWGDYVLKAIAAGPEKDIIDRKILYFSRLGNEAYDTLGRKIPNYQPRKFDNDPAYKKECYKKYGLTLEETQKILRLYAIRTGVSGSISIYKQYRVGSKEWEHLKKMPVAGFKYSNTMFNGQVRSSYLPFDYFQDHEYLEENASSAAQRFWREFRISPDPLEVATSTANGVIAAKYGVVKGNSTMANGPYKKLEQNFLQMQADYKLLIRQLRKKLQESGG